MLVIVQGKKFELNDHTLPKDGYLDLILHTDLGSDKIDGYYVLDVDLNDFEEYYKFLQFRTDFELREDLFDFMGHINLLKYPHDFWKVKLIDDRIREFWYYSNKDKNIHKNIDMIEISIPQDHLEDVHVFGTTNPISIPRNIGVSRIRNVMNYLPTRSLPKDHYIAGGAALYIAGITDKFKDIDIFTCNKDETMRYIESSYGPNKYYGMYQSGNAITMKGSVDIQFITREYSSPSQIIHGFDIPCCCILFDGKKLWTTTKGLYCINNGVNWFEPDRSSPTYALRLSKYHMRGFMLRLPNIQDIALNVKYYYAMRDKIKKTYYDKYERTEYNTEKLEELGDIIYIDGNKFEDEFKKYLNVTTVNKYGQDISNSDDLYSLISRTPISVDPEYVINALEDPKNGDRTYVDIVRSTFETTETYKYNDLIRTYQKRDDYEFVSFTEAYCITHISGDVDANPLAPTMSYMNDNDIEFEWPNDPMSIMISTSILGISPRIIGKKNVRHRSNIPDYEAGKTNAITSVNDINWYTGNPMEQGLTGTFYPEPIMEDVIDFYLSSPLTIQKTVVNNVSLEPRKWYRKRNIRN